MEEVPFRNSSLPGNATPGELQLATRDIGSIQSQAFHLGIVFELLKYWNCSSMPHAAGGTSKVKTQSSSLHGGEAQVFDALAPAMGGFSVQCSLDRRYPDT